jgi:hypothetical protein
MAKQKKQQPYHPKIRHQKQTPDKRRRETVSVCLRPRTKQLFEELAEDERTSISYAIADMIEKAIG